jgi:hypothetical protein
MPRLTVLAVPFLALLIFSSTAQARDNFGLRVTIFNQGTNLYALTPYLEGVSPITTIPLGVPVVEGMIPLGGGELLIGTSFHRGSFTYNDDYDDYQSSFALTGWIASVGYAFRLAQDETTALKAGGRAGMAIMGKVEMESTDYDGDTRSDSDDIDSSFQLSAFIAGEYFPAQHFGLSVETGLSFVTLAVGDTDQNWLNLYGAFSGIIRF